MLPRFFLRIAAPTIVLSLLLLAVGATAAWKVQSQQWESSQLISREVHGVLATEDVFLVMREIRRELDLYLRTHDRKHLAQVDRFLQQAARPIADAKKLARTDREHELIEIVDRGVDDFEQRFSNLRAHADEGGVDILFAELNDDFLTNQILQPIRESIKYNRQVVDRTTETALNDSRTMQAGFLMLGFSGSVAGLLSGVVIARTLNRAIVELDVSVRGVAGKLNEVGGPVQISRSSDLHGLETEFRKLETEIGGVVQRLQRRELELLRSEQLAVVGQLAAGMAHELRNALTPIKVLVQTALERGIDKTFGPQQLQIIVEETSRLEGSIQALLDFARPPALCYEKTNIAELVYQTFDLLSAKAVQQHVEMQAVIPQQRLLASVDRTQIRQMLLNLLLNSLDAMPQGGLLIVQLIPGYRCAVPTGGDITPHDALRLAYKSRRETFAIRIRDLGPGLPKDVLERAFEPFVTTKETGTGLGLSICRRIVEAHGGNIHVTNLPHRGAEFVIELPYANDA